MVIKMGTLTKGTILENTYEIVEEIGSGGGGIVFRAKHLRLQTDVVVKKIRDEVQNKVKLRQEADILKKLKHPYLPRVYDFIETADGVYTVMDFIYGMNLDEAMEWHGKYSQKQVKKWAIQLGEALDYLHSQNPPIIHSDIKPANIMVTEEGNICLIDFNISLAMGGAMESAVGISAGFSPPEQYRDPALYARITHNYTMRKSMESAEAQDDKTEILSRNQGADTDKTELLIQNQRADADKTELLIRNQRADADKTELLIQNQEADTDSTELLIQNGRDDIDSTELLIRNQEADTDRTELLIQNQRSNTDRTELLSQNQGAGNDKIELLSPSQEAQDNETLSLWKESERAGASAAPRQASAALRQTSGKCSEYTKFIGKGIDTRSDIYSLGVTLCYMLTGMEPSADFDGRAPLSETGASVSEGFALILDKMMEFSPDNRYQNGGEFLKAVQNCHKLDRRYIVMHRKQTGIQIAALFFLALGILTVFGGLYKLRKDTNSAYYNLVHQAQEAVASYDFEKADKLLTEAKEISDIRIEAYEEEVYLLYAGEKYEECVALGENYINTEPFLIESEEDRELFGNLYYLVGNAYFEMNDYPNARNLFQYALEYNERNGLYYRDYAITLAKLGQIEEAERQLEKGIGLGIAQDSIYMAQGEISHVKGEYDNAIEYLNRTIAATDDMQMKKRAVLLCADVYRTIGNDAVDREIGLLEQYAVQFEGNGSLVMSEYLAEAYTRKAQTDESAAEEYYGKALALFQSIYDSGYMTWQLQQNMAILYENLDRFDDAEEMLLDMAEKYPERYEVYKRLAYLEADRQQTKENEERDYSRMQIYYEQAEEKYSGKEQDMEMEMLERMMQELKDGGWL